jgi:hypothetical protein
LAVDVTTGQIAANDDYVYFLASIGDQSSASLELSRIPQQLGPREIIATQDLYGFGLVVHQGMVSWLARPNAIVPVQEDHVDWNLWQVAGPGEQPRAALEHGLVHLESKGTTSVVARLDPPRLQLVEAAEPTDLCPATGVNDLALTDELVVWSQYDALHSCSLVDGTPGELAPGEEIRPASVVADATHVYWGSASETGLWRASLSGEASENLLPEVKTQLLAAAAGAIYFVPDSAKNSIQKLLPESGEVEALASEQGFITSIEADSSYVYWLENVNQFSCLKRRATR